MVAISVHAAAAAADDDDDDDVALLMSGYFFPGPKNTLVYFSPPLKK